MVNYTNDNYFIRDKLRDKYICMNIGGDTMQVAMEFLLLALGFLMLVKGADWFVEGTSNIAKRFGIPQLVVGLTIVAMGTSAPETAVSITAALKGNAGIAIGNIVGSNILNILIILGITSVIIRVKVKESTLKTEIPFMILVTVVLYITGITGNYVYFYEGLILLVLFAGYLYYLFLMARKGKEAELPDAKKQPIWKLILLSIIGIVLIVWGSDVSVDAATEIATFFGMSDRFIGLTVVALGTSLPELVTSVMAALRGKADIAIGNIVGSNIFNILFVIGTSSLITPVLFESKFLFDTVIAVLAGGLLWISVAKTKELTRKWGVVMLAGYAGYFCYLLV